MKYLPFTIFVILYFVNFDTAIIWISNKMYHILYWTFWRVWANCTWFTSRYGPLTFSKPESIMNICIKEVSQTFNLRYNQIYQRSNKENPLIKAGLSCNRLRSCDSSEFIKCTPILIWSLNKESAIWSILIRE